MNAKNHPLLPSSSFSMLTLMIRRSGSPSSVSIWSNLSRRDMERLSLTSSVSRMFSLQSEGGPGTVQAGCLERRGLEEGSSKSSFVPVTDLSLSLTRAWADTFVPIRTELTRLLVAELWEILRLEVCSFI